MPDNWFLVPAVANGRGGLDPQYTDGHSQAGLHIPAADAYVVRVYGTASELDAIAAHDDTTRLSDSDIEQRLADATGLEHSRATWETLLRAGT